MAVHRWKLTKYPLIRNRIQGRSPCSMQLISPILPDTDRELDQAVNKLIQSVDELRSTLSESKSAQK
jgi:hypothetical protein